MRKGQFLSIVGLLHYITLFVLVIPLVLYILWRCGDPAVSIGLALFAVFKLMLWAVVATWAVNALIRRRRERLTRKVRSISPNEFVADFEVRGPFDGEYLAFSVDTHKLLIVDLAKKVSRCESLNFLRTWAFENDGVRTHLCFSFASLDFPSFQIEIPDVYRHDLTAKLEYLLR